MNRVENNQKLPEFFKPLFWSYNFDLLDLDKNKKTIILTIINYGDLSHWRWIKNHYGKEAITKIISGVSASELKQRTAKLVEILFKAKLNYAPRGTR